MITVEAVAEIVAACAEDEESRADYIENILTAVGEGLLGPILDATDDDYPDAASSAHYDAVSEWARDTAGRLDNLLKLVQP